MLGAGGVPWTQPGHHRLHGDVGESKRSGCKDISDAGVHLGIVALVGRHGVGQGLSTEDPREVVLPSQDLESDGEWGRGRSESWERSCGRMCTARAASGT